MGGMGSVLVTGMSGTGKSTALAELGRRGFRIVDTDSPLWSEWIPAVGEESGGWYWREEQISQLLTPKAEPTLYVSGTHSNQGKFYAHFDAVVLLSAPLPVILERVDSRITNGYGKATEERDLIIFHHRTVEPLLRATCTHEVDASRPLQEVVDELVAIGEDVSRRRG